MTEVPPKNSEEVEDNSLQPNVTTQAAIVTGFRDLHIQRSDELVQWKSECLTLRHRITVLENLIKAKDAEIKDLKGEESTTEEE